LTESASKEEARFFRGVPFGVVFSLPIWAVLIAAGMRLL
jgi:hypothetical protein